MSFPEPVSRTEKREDRNMGGRTGFTKHRGEGVSTKCPWQNETQWKLTKWSWKMAVKYYRKPQEARPQMPHLLIPTPLDDLSNPLTGRYAHA